MPISTTPFDAAEVLDTPEAVQIFLQDAFETEDASEIATALGVVARAKGMTEIARQAGLSRPALYRALSPEGRPELVTVVKVLKALGLRFQPVVGQPAA